MKKSNWVLQEECVKKIDETLDIMEKKLGREFPNIPVKFDLKGKTAGQFTFKNGSPYIRLNMDLLRQEQDVFIARTPGHEIIHYVDYMIHYSTGHGENWKRLMVMAGLDPTRCHKYDTSKTAVGGTFPWHCRCKTYHLSKIRNNRAITGKRYSCKICGCFLRSGELPLQKAADEPEEVKPTELETDFLGAFAEGDIMYLTHIEGYLDKVTLKQVSGVVSSLVKKELVETYLEEDDPGADHGRLQICVLTDKGKTVADQIRNEPKPKEDPMKKLNYLQTENGPKHIQEMTKKELVYTYNVAAKITGQPELKSFRDLKTGRNRVTDILAKALIKDINSLESMLPKQKKVKKEQDMGLILKAYEEVDDLLKSGRIPSLVLDWDHAPNSSLQNLAVTGHSTFKVLKAAIAQEISEGNIVTNIKVDVYEPPKKEEKPKAKKPAKKTNKATPNKPAKSAPKKKTTKYTRALALADSLNSLGKTSSISKEDLAQKSDARYEKKGGKSNVKEAKWIQNTTLPILQQMNILTIDGDTITMV